MVSGGINIIIYLNLLSTGYSYKDYFSFILTRVECLLFIIGWLIFISALWFEKKDDKNKNQGIF
jgi:uncharacterized membrane protein